MECYYGKRTNNRMYGNHSAQMGCRELCSDSNRKDSCRKEERMYWNKVEKPCNCTKKEEKDCDKAEDSCYPCKKEEWKDSPVGMGYVPWQCFRMLFDMSDGLESGTIFKELEKPFEVGFCARRCGC